jgi:hypothetical protein
MGYKGLSAISLYGVVSKEETTDSVPYATLFF